MVFKKKNKRLKKLTQSLRSVLKEAKDQKKRERIYNLINEENLI